MSSQPVAQVTAAHAHAAASRRLGREIAAALRRVFPQDVAFSLTASKRMGKITVKLETVFQDPEQASAGKGNMRTSEATMR